MKRTLYFAGGVAAVGLGALGLVLPVLPTTPFLLLAAFLFARSSKAHYDRLLAHRLLGPYVRDFAGRRGLGRRAKARALALLWAFLLPSSLWLGHRHISGFLLLLVGAAVSAYLLRLPTLAEDVGGGPPRDGDPGAGLG
jgi:hypothetical protein